MKYLKDQQSPAYLVPKAAIQIDLSDPERTKVISELQIDKRRDEDLVLDGNAKVITLNNDSISINGKKLIKDKDYKVTDSTLIIDKSALPTDTNDFTLSIEVNIEAENYEESKGFFQIGNTLCTQCESEGFRNITYFPDRPDILTQFETTLIQNEGQYPVVLSNGVVTDRRKTADGKDQVTYTHDEPKPPYLFAVVAGQLSQRTAEFEYKNGKKVKLEVYANPNDYSKTEHALNSIASALKWYEQNYGLIYEQDVLRIVAIDDFTFAAMENPTLILFNARDILADQNVASDADYMRIDRITAHEIFHYWVGHRLPIKNWFNFGFKEGVTVMMEELYSESKANLENLILRVNRINTRVFNADNKPNVHPILRTEYEDPDEREDFILYEKSAEVFRMLRLIVGEEGFRKSLEKYYETFDTKKFPEKILNNDTTNFEDFIKTAFRESPNTGVNPDEFMKWFTVPGAPTLTADWKIEKGTFTLRLTQSGSGPFVIPVRMCLVNADGSSSSEHILILSEKTQEFTFKNVAPGSIPSLLLGYSAYVKTDFMDKSNDKATQLNASPIVTHQFTQSLDQARYKGYKPEDLVTLMKSSDRYVSWRSMQDLAIYLLKKAIQEYNKEKGDPSALFTENLDFKQFIAALKSLFTTFDDERLSNMLALPTLSALIEEYPELDIDTLSPVYNAFTQSVIKGIEPELIKKSNEWKDEPYVFNEKTCASRKLFNQCFNYLTLIKNEAAIEHCKNNLDPEMNMTEKYSALASLANIPDKESIQNFFEQYKDNPLILLKWIRAQSLAQHPNVCETINSISELPIFDRGNTAQVIALYVAFANENHRYFHDKTGIGYECLANGVIKVAGKPGLAMRLLKFFASGEKLVDKDRIQLQIKQLERIKNHPNMNEKIKTEVVKQIKKLEERINTLDERAKTPPMHASLNK